LHITLKFLGDVDVSNVEQLTNAAKAAAASSELFEVAIVAPGAFRKRGKPAVLWLAIDEPSGALAELNSRLEDETAAAGFPREKRAFSPHLTIARIKVPEKNGELIEAHLAAPFEPAKFIVSELLVVRSDLGPSGSTYTTLSRHSLSGHLEI
jgi:RNA 2',3'-cyclic 3'-phosphodiesterase